MSTRTDNERCYDAGFQAGLAQGQLDSDAYWLRKFTEFVVRCSVDCATALLDEIKKREGEK